MASAAQLQRMSNLIEQERWLAFFPTPQARRQYEHAKCHALTNVRITGKLCRLVRLPAFTATKLTITTAVHMMEPAPLEDVHPGCILFNWCFESCQSIDACIFQTEAEAQDGWFGTFLAFSIYIALLL